VAEDKGQFKASAVIAVAALGWFAFPVSSFAKGGGPTSAKQGDPNGPQGTNNATKVAPPPPQKTTTKPSTKPTPKTKTTPKAKTTPKPMPKKPRLNLRLGQQAPRIGGQSQRMSLRLKQPLARTTVARTGRLNLRTGRLQSFGSSAPSTTTAKPKPKTGQTPAPKPAPKPSIGGGNTTGGQQKAPKGGITVNGKFYKGGQYLPSP
jgi:hypothetical protein